MTNRNDMRGEALTAMDVPEIDLERAAKTIAKHARDDADAAELLDMIGLKGRQECPAGSR